MTEHEDSGALPLLPPRTRTYTRATVEHAFRSFAWLLVEGLDDAVNLVYGDQLVRTAPSEATRHVAA